MQKRASRKTKWTLSFDPALKSLVVRAARRKGVYPGALLEDIVRERFNPYGHTDVKESVGHVSALRRVSSSQTDEQFLAEIKAWQRSRFSLTRN